MKNFITFIVLFVSSSVTILCQPTVNGRFLEITNNGTNYVVKVQILTNTGTDILGDATIPFTFNITSLTYINTTFSNFSGGDYFTATATNTPANRISLNIVLNNTGGGTIVTNTFMDVATITFNTTNPAGSSNLTFASPLEFFSPTATQWNNGTFTNLNTNPLPVELSSFTGKADGNRSVDLKWVTKTEVNNYGFYVEKKVNDGDWNSITFVEGNGNSNSPKEYGYTDKDVFVGGSKFLYRLKQVDTDGQSEYSDVVEVELVPTEFDLSQNYPNPFNPSTTIRFSLPKQIQLKLNLYNMLGQLVETIAEGTYEAGYYKVNFNSSNLSSGMYIYRIESSDFVKTMKMMLLK
jgi:hypothetical protein